MKKVLFLSMWIITLISVNAYPQSNKPITDKVILNSGSIIDCKVLKVDNENVEIDPDGSISLQILKRTDVNTIVYSNGTVVNIKETPNSNNIKNTGGKTDFRLRDKNGWPVEKITVLSENNIIIQRDLTTYYRKSAKNDFFYTEDGEQKSLSLNVFVRWDNWWARANLRSALATTNFLVIMEIIDKETNKVIEEKSYPIYGDLNFGTPSTRPGTNWTSEPAFDYKNWRFSLFLFIPTPKWKMAYSYDAEVIRYSYTMELSIQSNNY